MYYLLQNMCDKYYVMMITPNMFQSKCQITLVCIFVISVIRFLFSDFVQQFYDQNKIYTCGHCFFLLLIKKFCSKFKDDKEK